MQNATLINGTTLDQLKETLMQGFKHELADFKKFYSPKEPDDFLTRKETASLLKISLVTVHQWSNDKILTKYKIGNRSYYSRKEITEKMLNSNTQ